MAYSQLFSQRFGYALHTLCYMAKKPAGSLTTAPELVNWMQEFWPTTSETYLVSVIQRLARGGLLRSHRGKLGGYSLSRKPEVMTLRNVMTSLEGVQAVACNLAPGGDCPAHADCGILRRLIDMEEAYLELLEGVSIAELACELGVSDPGAAADQLLPIVT
jgi:Rrf2 family protein